MTKPTDYRSVTAAYDQRSVDRMIANGSTEQHAYQVMADKRRKREAKRAKQSDSLPPGTGTGVS